MLANECDLQQVCCWCKLGLGDCAIVSATTNEVVSQYVIRTQILFSTYLHKVKAKRSPGGLVDIGF